MQNALAKIFVSKLKSMTKRGDGEYDSNECIESAIPAMRYNFYVITTKVPFSIRPLSSEKSFLDVGR